MKTQEALSSRTTLLPHAIEATNFRLYLQDVLLSRCEKNPAYSLRAFARTLDCDVATLSKILKGQRGIGRITIEKLGMRLGLSPQEISAFVVQRKRGKHAVRQRSIDSVEINYQQLTLDHFKIIADWYHFAILEVMALDRFKADSKWVARRLGISASEVNAAVERLERTQMIKITPEGKWVDLTDGTSTTTGNPFSDVAFRKLQKQVLEKAITALEEIPMNLRDQTSVTMAIDSDLIPEAKKRIRAFRRDLSRFLSRGKRRDAVYQLGISLFPLTKGQE